MPRTHRTGTATGTLVAGLLLAGCTGEPEPAPVEVDRTPTTDVEAPAAVDTGDLRVPLQVDTVAIVDPGWDTRPQSAGGVTLGAGEQDGVVLFTAVDAAGEALWSVERPADHAAYTVTTTSDGRALAVLTDAVPDDDGTDAPTTATAYDLSTGAVAWGPVDVPGALTGPGLVFAEASAEDPAAAGPVVLDPDSGDAVEPAGAQVLGEYDGTVVAHDGTELVASTVDGEESWRVALAEHGWEAATLAPGTEPAPTRDTARLRVDAGAEALLDLAGGDVLADGFTDVGVDPAIGAVVSVDEAEVRGTGTDGAELWTASTGQETSIEGVSGALAYLRVGESLRAHNVLTGSIAEAYAPDGTGDLVVPVDVTEAGSIVLSDYSSYLLATTETSADTSPEADTGSS